MIGEKEEKKKKGKLRYNEYYDTQEMFDDLYARAKKGEKFYTLYELIIDEKNISLAYRTIKSNKSNLKVLIIQNFSKPKLLSR